MTGPNAPAAVDVDAESATPHVALPETALSQVLDRGLRRVGDAMSWIWVILLFVIVSNVVLRYAFGQGRIEFEEVQWHLYSVGFLVGEVSPNVEPSILRARVFAGYSGWGPGQLEAEIAVDSWIIERAREDDVFTDAPDLLWSRVLERKGPEYRQLSRMPYDPSMN